MIDDSTREPLRDRLHRALTLAMKENDRVAISAFRSALGAIDNAEAVPSSATPTPTSGPVAGARSGLGVNEVPRRGLSEGEIAEVVRTEIDERRAAASTYDAAPSADRAAPLRAEANALERQLDDA